MWNAETLKADPGSITHLYRRLIGLRHAEPALRLGKQDLVDLSPDVVAWERTHGENRFLIVVNMSQAEAVLNLDGEWSLEISSDPSVASWTGTLGANTAVVLRG